MATFTKGERAKNQGGARAGAGRKPKLLTVLKRQIAEHGADETQYAFGLLCAIMRNDAAPIKERREAAVEVLNRTLGKPATTINLNSNPVEIHAFDYGTAITAIAPGPIPHHDGGGGNVSGGDGPPVGENVDGR